MKQTVILLVFAGIISGFFLPFWLQGFIIVGSIICLISFLNNSDGPEGAGQLWWVKFAGAFYGSSLSLGLTAANLIQLILSNVLISIG